MTHGVSEADTILNLTLIFSRAAMLFWLKSEISSSKSRLIVKEGTVLKEPYDWHS